ncbi:MAG: ABC transporter ATP-binding protein [Chloroflexota bacterium]|nr:ABC transporter ATP-binding protein [Chloroflexota bacterium]
MIEVHQLTKKFGDRIAVDRISFSAKPGEVIGLLGANGAGKTTTMRLLTGFLPPTEGSATIAGHDVVTDSLDARRAVGYLPERVPVYPDMTVREFVTFWARLRGRRDAQAGADAAIERVNLSDRRNTLIRNLSKGMKQRLGFAQALAHDPPVLILDEPTIGIDPQQVIEIRETVRALGQTKTVLFSTHILSEADSVCDRVLILHQGRIVAQGTPADLKRKLKPGATLEDVFLSIVGKSVSQAGG